MRYDRDNENTRRGQSGYNRRNERYHQFGAEEDRSMRDSSRDFGRFRNNDSSYMDDDYFREQDRNFESESRSNLGTDQNFGGRSSSFSQNRNYGEARYERDPYPTQNRNPSSRFESDYSMDRRDYSNSNDRSGYRSYSGGRSHGQYFGDFSGSHEGNYESRGRYEPEHRSMWESVKDFFGVGPKGYSRSDDRIREDVSDALTRDRAVDASEIEVSVMSGAVILRGSVSDKWMKRRAEDCAEEVPGVKDVRNELEVRRENGSNMDYLSSSGRTGSMSTGGSLSSTSGLNSSTTLSAGNSGLSSSKSSERGSDKSSSKRKLS